jgi:DNA (cytosine-5)-methyltransferase 1
MRPRLLDLYCAAGGASMGYSMAGFDVTGVDLLEQPRYPFKFWQADAITFLAEYAQDFDVVTASPPCQAYSPLSALPSTKDAAEHPDLVAATRDALNATGKPWVIENVMTAPLMGGIVLCGSMFGLRTYRHRRFEFSGDLALIEPIHPRHRVKTATKSRRERWDQGWNVSITGDVGTYVGEEAMGITWMNGGELCLAIPPAYTEFIGVQLLEHLASREVA